jgi:hypothetical protein
MDERVIEQLKSPDMTPFLTSIQNHCFSLIQMSHSAVAENFERWDQANRVYRARRDPDKDDKRAAERDEPVKMAVPVSYSQVETFVSFVAALYDQKRLPIELEGFNEEGHRSARIAESVIDRDLEMSGWPVVRHMFLTDLCKYGVGILKSTWREEVESRTFEQPIQADPVLGGLEDEPQMVTVTEEVPTFQGTRILNVSPYRFFPDPRFPLSRFQEGEFCGSEDEYSFVELKRLEREGLVAGVDHIETFSKGALNLRKSNRFSNLRAFEGQRFGWQQPGQSYGSIVVTEIELDIIPSKFFISGDDDPLGPEDYPIRHLVWLANDTRPIRVERMVSGHGKYSYDVAEYSPDQQDLYNESLTDLIHYLQSTMTWMLNARVTNVRKTVSNQFVVDTSAIHVEDLRDRKHLIRKKAEASGMPIDQSLHQVKMVDITQGHVNDSQTLLQFIQFVTGISDNALGQFHTGRRSATEARQVAQGSFNRLKHHAKLAHRAIEGVADKIVKNAREGMTAQTLLRLVGETPEQMEQADAFLVSGKDLVGRFDFKKFDATLPSEKHMIADVLREVLTSFVGNPEAFFQLGVGYNVQLLMDDLMVFLGVRNPERYHLDLNPNPGATVVPPGQPEQAPQQPAPVNDPIQSLLRSS